MMQSSFAYTLVVILALIQTALAHDTKSSNEEECACEKLLKRPDLWKKELVARWMAHSLDWGTLTTISTRSEVHSAPFGNIYSFVDGPCEESTGIPYFYGTYMDQSFIDMKRNPSASFTLSEASLASVCGAKALPACSVAMNSNGVRGDPESPVCARLTLTGKMVEVPKESDEYAKMLAAFYARHAQMQYWPVDHDWVIAKLEVSDVWFIDYFGGASILDVDAYLNANIMALKESN